MAASGDRDVGVRVEGLADLRRDLRRISPELNRELSNELKGIGEDVASAARSHAVRRTGKYASTIRAYATGGGVSVGSRLPQAGVLHWGGTIRPRGVDITFAARPVISEAADRLAPEIIDKVGEALEDAARRAGWRR